MIGWRMASFLCRQEVLLQLYNRITDICDRTLNTHVTYSSNHKCELSPQINALLRHKPHKKCPQQLIAILLHKIVQTGVMAAERTYALHTILLVHRYESLSPTESHKVVCFVPAESADKYGLYITSRISLLESLRYKSKYKHTFSMSLYDSSYVYLFTHIRL